MISIDANRCAGCHLCELACSFHHLNAFSPRRSSIEVQKNDATGEMKIRIFDDSLDIRSGCDGCPENQIPLCVMWCPTNAVSMDLSKPAVTQ